MSEPRRTDSQLLRRAVKRGDPAAGLAALGELRRRLDALEAAHVQDAIRDGWPWTRVGAALGLTRQAAHARHARQARREEGGLVVAGRARTAVKRARGEAAELGAAAVGPEHLLLALLAEPAGPVAETLAATGLTHSALRERLAPHGARAARSGAERSVAPQTREALEQSLREAVARGDDRLDVEHLLLALLREPGTLALLTAGGRTARAIERTLNRALRAQSS
jgi:hypothetical protein